MLVCVFPCLWIRVSVYVRVNSPGLLLGIFLGSSPLYTSRQSLSLESPEPACPRKPLSLSVSGLMVYGGLHLPGLVVGAKELNSSPHTGEIVHRAPCPALFFPL